ncbi:MAG TPA: hypothetical protein VK644_12110 [Chitinophagaceae bacterium]|nr:hypothetical protein [Chitinophagaceae bacterium]
MKRFLLTIGIAMLFSLPVFSQAYESSIDYDKKKQPAVTIDYPYSQEAVENAIVQKIEKMGHKSKTEKGLFNKDKGFIIFKDAYITDISADRMDYIVKVERKSRKDKDETTLYLILAKNGENAWTALDAEGVRKAKAFLNNLQPEIEDANLELQIKDQETNVTKSEKKFKDMTDEKASLEKKLKKLGEDIEKQQKDIENGRLSLDGMKGKRRLPATTN